MPFLRERLDRHSRPGSNQWAVSGRHTASGLPMVANDPHLSLGTPSTFYPIHLTACGTDVMGSGFAGVPFVIVGQNRYIAWGATVNPMDVTDVYAEQLVPDGTSPSGYSSVYRGKLEPVIPIPEVFRYNVPGDGIRDNLVPATPGSTIGSTYIPPATLIVPRRNQGPIVNLDVATGAALSVQYTGFSGTREIETFLIWDNARGLDDFVRGLQFFDSGTQNFAYADVHGNIAYFTSSEMPIREDLQAGIVNGAPPWFIRNGRGGNEWLPVKRRTIDATLGPLPKPAGQQAVSALRNLLDHFAITRGVGASGVDFFVVPGVAGAEDRRDIVILQSVGNALTLLAGPSFAAAFNSSTDQTDYRWGKLHRIVLSHPLGSPFSIPPAGGAFPPPLSPLPGIPADGGFGAVDASNHDARAESVTASCSEAGR